MKKLILFFSAFIILTSGILFLSAQGMNKQIEYNPDELKISLAYVITGQKESPDPFLFSHLIYAFCDFNDNNDGIVIEDSIELATFSNLKKINPDLKLILGIGGYKREGFSEMSGDSKKRRAFVSQCNQIIKDYNLDGIDLDWEFPGTTAGGHTASPNDAKNYGLLVKDLRKVLGTDKWISFYSNNSGSFIDFKRMLPYVDYVNVSGYNLSTPQPNNRLYHQSAIFGSKACGSWCVSKVIDRHLSLGVPREKVLMGIPFFGRGINPFPSYIDYKKFPKYVGDSKYVWDNDAKAPYYADEDGTLVLGFDNEQSIKIKCDYIRANGLAGGFVWHYHAEPEDHSLAKVMRENLLNRNE